MFALKGLINKKQPWFFQIKRAEKKTKKKKTKSKSRILKETVSGEEQEPKN